jgi:hypothetical protein
VFEEVLMSEQSETDQRRVTFWLAIGAAILAAAMYLYWVVIILPWSFDDNAGRILQAHYPAAIGLPAAVLISFVVVALFRQAAGPIEIGVPGGFQLKGATGPVILWALCFFVTTWAIKEVWGASCQ